MPKIAVMMAAWLIVMLGYGNRQGRKTATIIAISAMLTQANNPAMGHGRCAAATFVSKSAANTEVAALPQRTFGKRIKSAAAIALAGQKSAMPPGTRVNRIDMEADANTANPVRISLKGALFSARRIWSGSVDLDGMATRGKESGECRRSSRSALRKASSF